MGTATVYLFVLFLVTTFCLNGLTTAIVQRWFRDRRKSFLVLTLCLFPLMWVQAYELFWILSIQQLTILLGLGWLNPPDESQPFRSATETVAAPSGGRQLTLTAAFAWVLLIALIFSVFAKTQAQGSYQIANMMVIGVTCGFAVLAARSVAAGCVAVAYDGRDRRSAGRHDHISVSGSADSRRDW